MARKAWLLVEWVDEKNMIPSYGIVNVDTLCFNKSDLQPGKKILISIKLNEPRQAQIIRIAEKKSHVQEHKDFLERQDQQVKNVLQLCMRTIKEMKSEQCSSATENSIPDNTSQQNNFSYIVPAYSENSASDNDSGSETGLLVHHSRVNKSRVKHESRPSLKREESKNYHNRSVHSVSQRRRSIVSSTPLPDNRVQKNIKLCFDQGTQTDDTLLQPPLAKIEEMELTLKQLYARFQTLSKKTSIDVTEDQNYVLYMDPISTFNEPCVSNVVECVENTSRIHNIVVGEDNNSQPIMNHSETKVNVKMESDRNLMRVRRMSAQTTDNEMLPIGDGNAIVPGRLFNDIDWNSYTTATRQLLQAIFSRKVLATHSLTGKQSPAHLHKPPKKILDPKLVDDIVKTVSMRCGVPKNLVRNSITVKCTDEAKLYRNRQRQKPQAGLQSLQNEENVPLPTTPSSDESANLVS